MEDLYWGALRFPFTSFCCASPQQFFPVTTEFQIFLQCVVLMTEAKRATLFNIFVIDSRFFQFDAADEWKMFAAQALFRQKKITAFI